MKKISFLILCAAIVCPHVLAQMPVPLLDNETSTPPSPQWKAAAPILQAALECRQRLDPNSRILRPLLPPNDTSQWELTPPRGFTVFGLPVQAITLYIDPDGEMGASYAASVPVSKVAAKNATKLTAKRSPKVGSLMVQQSSQGPLTDIVCTVNGSRDQE